MNESVSKPIESVPELPADMTGLLLDWYDAHRRFLPWREDPTPYHVWVSEIMLQQTRVDTVIPYYERFMKELPDVRTLAEVPEERLLKLWEGLGYYSRVRNMQKAAIQIMQDHNGVIPSDPARLEKLSGIGAYTAAAIASIAYQVRIPSVDGNLLRVYARLAAYREDIRTAAAKKLAENAFLSVLPKDRPGDMNQALMDIGATICLPNGAPLCNDCPFAGFCETKKKGLQDEIPKAREKSEKLVDHKTVFLILADDLVLLNRRDRKGLLAGLYEFPNTEGTLKKEEAVRYCSSFGFDVSDIKPAGPARHVFSHRIWEMTGYEVRILNSIPPVLPEGYLFVPIRTLIDEIAIPAAFFAYSRLIIPVLSE